MILLDTNVISEGMTREPNPRVRAWFDAQMPGTLFLSTISVAELRFGIGVLPEGRRKAQMTATLDEILGLFGPRILPFDNAAAEVYAGLAVKARNAGLGFPLPDGYIAAIAASVGFAVASRDRSAFLAAGLTVIDPWTV